MSVTGNTLGELVSRGAIQFTCSDEVNFEVRDPVGVMARVFETYKASAKKIDHADGLGIEFERWHFGLWLSNTGSLLRPNIEARDDPKLVEEKLLKIGNLIQRLGAIQFGCWPQGQIVFHDFKKDL